MRNRPMLFSLALAACLLAGAAHAQCLDPGVSPGSVSRWTAPDGGSVATGQATTVRPILTLRATPAQGLAWRFLVAIRGALFSLAPPFGIAGWDGMPAALEARALREERR